MSDTPSRVSPSAPAACDCDGLWNDPELRMGPEARESYNRTGHLPNCPLASASSPVRSRESRSEIKRRVTMQGGTMEEAFEEIKRVEGRGTEEEFGKLLDAWKEQIILGEDSYDEHEDYDRWQRRETAARLAVESYVSRLRDERDKLKRFETYVCQVIAMGNQADLTVEALPR